MKNLKLKAARAAMDLSQEELAKRCNVSRQTINAIEKGDYNPTINLCIAIYRQLNKTLDELFWEEEVWNWRKPITKPARRRSLKKNSRRCICILPSG